ncbi:glycosyltransferase [Altererythrobacter sp. SALINAS58]|uniref:glycosyltransferase n=1 Tax=Alteripontixanthobacter muriae TaxID=2705546 RepID=UPI0015767D93|nr:glycosyltransferase [Alteripontixanthobacter muriae]NTZ41532.1 glycosyltransferase [Alteripontixanthobacter muriae]
MKVPPGDIGHADLQSRTNDSARAVVVVLAHDEERRIAACLSSLAGQEAAAIHVVVNGSTDRTAEIARASRLAEVHVYEEGGKARSWNRFVLDTIDPVPPVLVLVDGDAQITTGSIAALARCLEREAHANAAAGMPRNGRRAGTYRAEMRRDHGLFGDFYALRGNFVERVRASGIRLPDDLIGDDSLIGALAKTDLGHEDQWSDGRIAVCEDARFLCEPTPFSPSGMRGQARRMSNYSVRHFQNRIVSDIMRGPGPAGLPRRLAELYPRYLPTFRPRRHPLWAWFDRQALARMRSSAAALPTFR